MVTKTQPILSSSHALLEAPIYIYIYMERGRERERERERCVPFIGIWVGMLRCMLGPGGMQLSVPPLLRVRLPDFVVTKSHVCLLTGGARRGGLPEVHS